ncbi:hypothetical protein [Microbacterium telephonicum]|uniref:Uncharacterized protein n=1 Tax=Microbacterium telephonicum TaxID=1714841 RepID=A0A498C948_9MICO|nr:hypothetical protein [Microbacterium telephonicum]RLK52272.1 hypothetical protein C7474_0204 [Microbacterium telephonicum]
MTSGSDLSDRVDALRAASAARTRDAQLAAQQEVADALVRTRTEELAVLQERLRDETADVERLERISPTRLWATLRGDAVERLATEKAEQDAAARAVAGAQTRLAAAQAEAGRAADERRGLGDVEAGYTEALTGVEGAVRASGGVVADELTAIGAELGEVTAQRREVVEAQEALRVAVGLLQDALGALDSAGGWSTYDTFFGGGFLADMMKHDRIDAATTAFTRVNRALEHLAVELADINAAPVRGIDISPTLAVFDVMFDNMFTDWIVRDRIAAAREAAVDLRVRLSELERHLAERGLELANRLAALAARRAELLTAVR